jgi:hypothetical protein
MDYRDFNLGIFTIRKFKRHIIFPLHNRLGLLVTVDISFQNKNLKRLFRLWMMDLLTIIDCIVKLFTLRLVDIGFSRTFWVLTERKKNG